MQPIDGTTHEVANTIQHETSTQHDDTNNINGTASSFVRQTTDDPQLFVGHKPWRLKTTLEAGQLAAPW